jgi:protein-disulfide isomerase
MSRLLLAGLIVLTACSRQTSQSRTSSAPAAQAANQAADPKAPVARIGGDTITTGDLDSTVKSDLRRLEGEYQERVYGLKKSALEQMIVKRLVEAKAKAAGIAPEDLVKREVLDKIPDAGKEEIQSVYDRAKAAGQQLPPIDQVRGQIVTYLKQQKSQDALRGYYEKLKAEAKVEMLLPPFRPARVEVAATGPSKGSDKAPVIIVEFSDFECPFCSKAEATVTQVMAEYKDKVRVVFRDFPLPFHPRAQKASEAGQCASDQGKFWEMHGKLFANQNALEVPALKGYAKDLGLDQARFDKCLDSGEKAKIIEANRKAGEEVGVSGTPAFFVNGMLINGAQPFEAFKSLIDAELAQK